MTFGVTLQQLVKLEDDVLTALFWLNLNWNDANLEWSTTPWDNVFEQQVIRNIELKLNLLTDIIDTKGHGHSIVQGRHLDA